MMYAYLSEIWQELLLQRMKALLSLLGFVIGSALCVGLLSIGLNAQFVSMAQFSALDTDLLHVDAMSRAIKVWPFDSAVLTHKLAESDANIEKASGLFHISTRILFRDQPVNAFGIITSTSLYPILQLNVDNGRLLRDLDRTQAFCVIGSALAKELQDRIGHSPLGENLTIGKQVFTIIGVLNPSQRGSFLFLNIDRTVFLNMAQLPRFSDTEVNEWVIKIKDISQLPITKQRIEDFFRQISPTIESHIESLDELIKNIEKQNRLFILLLLSIGLISLVGSGIGIMNVMLISIESRKPEIGIRLTVGALPKDILIQFLKEAAFLTIMGAVLGVALGEALSFVLCLFFAWSYHFFLLPAGLGVLMSIVTGMAFGYYPALKASRVNPLFLLNSV